MSQFTDFQSGVLGKPIETEDPSNLNQCFDLALAWCDYMKIPRETIRHLRAFQIWTQPTDITLQYFDYIPDTPTNTPPEGALVIFSDAVGVSGHVSIGTGSGDKNGFTSLDQNWSGVQVVRLVNHVYTSVLGWLQIKKSPVASVDPIIFSQSDSFIAVATKLNVAANKDVVIGEIEKLIGFEDAVVVKDKLIAEANAQVVSLETKITALQQDHDVLTKEVAVQAQTIQEQDIQIKSLGTSLQEIKDGLTKPDWSSWELIWTGIKKLFLKK